MKALLRLLRIYHHVLIFIILEVIALVLLSNHNAYQHSKLVNLNREISGRMFQRIEGAREYLALKADNESLVRENTLLRNQLEAFRADLSDSGRVEFNEIGYKYTMARVVHASFFKQYNYLTLDKGTNDGIDRDMGVVSADGLVGIVLESSRNFSTVLPIINRDFKLSVKIKKSNYAGILEWDGKSHMEANLQEIPFQADVAIGDSIVTSGFSAIFPEGIFVGTVLNYSIEEGNFYRIVIDLGADFQRVFHVNVVENFYRLEQRELEQNKGGTP